MSPAPYARVHAGHSRMPILLFRLPRYLFPVLSMNSRAQRPSRASRRHGPPLSLKKYREAFQQALHLS